MFLMTSLSIFFFENALSQRSRMAMEIDHDGMWVAANKNMPEIH